jgi:hypothetical protein
LATSDKQTTRDVDRGASDLEVVPSGGGFILKVGPMSLWVDRAAAEELMCLLADVLEPSEPLDVLPSGVSN